MTGGSQPGGGGPPWQWQCRRDSIRSIRLTVALGLKILTFVCFFFSPNSDKRKLITNRRKFQISKICEVPLLTELWSRQSHIFVHKSKKNVHKRDICLQNLICNLRSSCFFGSHKELPPVSYLVYEKSRKHQKSSFLRSSFKAVFALELNTAASKSPSNERSRFVSPSLSIEVNFLWCRRRNPYLCQCCVRLRSSRCI